MRSRWTAVVAALCALSCEASRGGPTVDVDASASPSTSTIQKPRRGVVLEDLTWIEANKVLTPDTVVVIPVGASSKEHGPHLKLKNDWLLAEYFKGRVLETADVVMAPTVAH